jgi:hypothetical protein
MRKAKMFAKSDERIVGDGDLVEQVLSEANEQMERKNILKSIGYNLKMITDRVSTVMELEASEIWKTGKSRRRAAARSLICKYVGRPQSFSKR